MDALLMVLGDLMLALVAIVGVAALARRNWKDRYPWR